MLVVRPVHDDERLAERRCITGIKGGVPLLVFVAEPNNDNIGGGNAVAMSTAVLLLVVASTSDKQFPTALLRSWLRYQTIATAVGTSWSMANLSACS